MIPYEANPSLYWATGMCLVVFVMCLILSVAISLSRKSWALSILSSFTAFMLILTILSLGVLYTSSAETITINVCNKETGGYYTTIVSTDQQDYLISDPILNMKSPIGKQIVAHTSTSWFNSRPVIYAIDGPIPCGNTTGCGV